jgi:hypothetical protein
MLAKKVRQQGQDIAHDTCRHRLCRYPDRIVQLLARDFGKSEKIEWDTGVDRYHELNTKPLFLMRQIGFCDQA